MAPSVTIDVGDPLGEPIPNYTGFPADICLTVCRAANAGQGFVDIDPGYCGVVDVWPIMDTGSWKWVTVIGDASAQNLAFASTLLLRNGTAIVTRLLATNQSSGAVNPLIGPGGLKTNPFACLLSAKGAEMGDTQAQTNAVTAEQEAQLSNS